MFNTKTHTADNKTDYATGGLFFKHKLQPKLTINQPNDVYEQEADAMADKVMRMQMPSVQTRPTDISYLQRKCAHCEEEEKMQRKEINGNETTADSNLENYISNLNGSGQSLPNEVRSFYEPRFGYDFSNVKVHTDNVAAKSAQSINALAYTLGNNIVFNNNQYSPETDAGKKLLAHELTHVMQQAGYVQHKIKDVNSSQQNSRKVENAALFVQSQTPPNEALPQNDEIVQMIIDSALERNGTVGNAFHDLRKRRCENINCGNENLAAAEHYMFARWWIEDSKFPPELMALIFSGAISAYQVVKLLPIVPSFCPNDCPPTPPSLFQFGWAMTGVGDGLIVSAIPTNPY